LPYCFLSRLHRPRRSRPPGRRNATMWPAT
jgi:hypothetical protein